MSLRASVAPAMGCEAKNPGNPACPETLGPDFDFSATPILVKAGKKDLIVIPQKSAVAWAFDPDRQVMSIYYNFRFLSTPKFPVKQIPFDFDEKIADAQIFRWVDVKTLSKDHLTLPVDKMMVDFIRKEAF